MSKRAHTARKVERRGPRERALITALEEKRAEVRAVRDENTRLRQALLVLLGRQELTAYE